MWDQLFDRDMANFIVACACFGAAWGFFELVARSSKVQSRRGIPTPQSH